jgi:hypothetical protein
LVVFFLVAMMYLLRNGLRTGQARPPRRPTGEDSYLATPTQFKAIPQEF